MFIKVKLDNDYYNLANKYDFSEICITSGANILLDKTSKEEILIDEGCLTYPGVWLKVKRPIAIKVEFEDEKGEKHEREFQGLTSRIFQHEYDHMQGTDFTQKVSRLKIERAMKKLNKTVKKLKISPN